MFILCGRQSCEASVQDRPAQAGMECGPVVESARPVAGRTLQPRQPPPLHQPCACINVNHLVAGTRAENNADRAVKGRSAKSKPTTRIISAEQADWIRKHYVHQRGNKPNPFGVSSLARKFGVDTGTIYNILKRKTHL